MAVRDLEERNRQKKKQANQALGGSKSYPQHAQPSAWGTSGSRNSSLALPSTTNKSAESFVDNIPVLNVNGLEHLSREMPSGCHSLDLRKYKADYQMVLSLCPSRTPCH